MDFDDSEFIDEIVPDRLPVHTGPPIDEFQPWHRVRKEFIRQNQWNKLAICLIDRRWHRDLGRGAESPLKCLVIPGDDLLDIRALWRDTEEQECYIRYLGFNERHGSRDDGTRIHVANNAVTSLSRISKDSQVIADRFESIVHPNSQARRYLLDYGPYHVINLDFCGSIFPNTQANAQPYHAALLETLAYQFAKQKSNWLLFVTTEVQPSIADRGQLEPFAEIARKNYDNHSDFREVVTEFLPATAFECPNGSVNIGDLNEEQTVNFFGVAFGKWLLKLSHSAQPKWTIGMRKSFQYKINTDKGVVMLALAFEFSPNIVPPRDDSGISNHSVPPKEFPDECECAVRIARSVANIKDVDFLLQEDPQLKRKLENDSADLLQAAGFNREAYLQWAAKDY